ncbi:antistasin isoform X2 [Biomphalaria glabrata]|nr:antistasin isoform X2 [Biomphalaria glabrata]
MLAKIFFLLPVSGGVVEIKRQDCVEHCTPGTNEGCHPYQICIANHAVGCGTSCHYILPGKRAICLGAMCNVYCPYGHKLSADGCPMCACNPGPVV